MMMQRFGAGRMQEDQYRTMSYQKAVILDENYFQGWTDVTVMSRSKGDGNLIFCWPLDRWIRDWWPNCKDCGFGGIKGEMRPQRLAPEFGQGFESRGV